MVPIHTNEKNSLGESPQSFLASGVCFHVAGPLNIHNSVFPAGLEIPLYPLTFHWHDVTNFKMTFLGLESFINIKMAKKKSPYKLTLFAVGWVSCQQSYRCQFYNGSLWRKCLIMGHGSFFFFFFLTAILHCKWSPGKTGSKTEWWRCTSLPIT